MPSVSATRAAPVTAAVVALATIAACGSIGSDETETVVESVDLSGVEVTVGSKAFAEQELLGQITIEVLQAAGATVEDRTGLPSTSAARQALESGATDMYWEYTGTGWLVILGQPNPVSDPGEQYEAVAAKDRQENGIAWVAPAPANNTYAIAVRNSASEGLTEVETLSDLSDLLQQSEEQATLCVASEFANRPDGLPGLERAYGWGLPADNVITLDQEDLLYPAVAKGSVCNFGEVFRTDGRIDALDLRLLEDDEDFFAAYNPTLTMRQELLDQYPELEELFDPIAAVLDEQTLRELNTRVDVDNEPVEDVAQDFLEDEGFLTPQQLTR